MAARARVGSDPRDVLVRVDDGLLRLRRLWSASRSRLVDDLGTTVEMSSLLVVEACGRGVDAGAETTVGDVARFADVTASTASRLVDRAEAAALVRRLPSAEVPRATALELTPAGAALRHRASAARLAWLGAQVAGWSDRDVREFARLLGRFADGLGASHP